MTKEEIIRNLKYTMEKHKNDIVPTFGTDILLMCKDILDYLEQEPKWTPVSKELPKVADCYLVTRDDGDDLMVSACYFDGIHTWHDDNWINDERNYLTDIIAWMPLPEEYKPEGYEGE